MATEYTKEMIAELTALSPVDNTKALTFAAKHGISVQSVRAKCVPDENIEYVAKPKTRKDGSPVERKSEIVEEIAAALNVDAESMESLENATRLALVRVRDALQG